MGEGKSSSSWVTRDSLDLFAAFVALGLTFTAISLLTSPLEVRVGTLRAPSTIPNHELDLIGTGVAISVIVMLGLRKFDLSSLLLSVSFIVFLDLDHLPSALGIPQPIRPAHSLIFLAVLLVILTLLFKKPASVQLTVVASFLGHLAADTGTFPLLAPLSYGYYSLSSLDAALYVSAGLVALLAGYLGSRSRGNLRIRGTPTLGAPGEIGWKERATRGREEVNPEFTRMDSLFTRLK